MVKKAFFAFFASLLFAFGADLRGDLGRILGENHPAIENIMQNERSFIDERNNVNYNALFARLKNQGLLEPSNSANIQIGFSSPDDNAILMVKAVGEVLSKMGYKYYLTTHFDANSAQWGIALSSRNSLEPGVLYSQLANSKIYIKKISKQEANFYIYELDLSRASVDSDTLNVNQIRPQKPYFLTVVDKKSLSIEADSDDSFQPFIRVFDKNLKLIKTQKSNTITYSLTMESPAGANYVLIEDSFSLENIKHGLKINLN